MMNTTERLLNEALQLPYEQRQHLVDRLMESLHPGDDLSEEEWQAAWLPELKRRVADIESGRVKAVPVSQFLDEIADRQRARHES